VALHLSLSLSLSDREPSPAHEKAKHQLIFSPWSAPAYPVFAQTTRPHQTISTQTVHTTATKTIHKKSAKKNQQPTGRLGTRRKGRRKVKRTRRNETGQIRKEERANTVCQAGSSIQLQKKSRGKIGKKKVESGRGREGREPRKQAYGYIYKTNRQNARCTVRVLQKRAPYLHVPWMTRQPFAPLYPPCPPRKRNCIA